MKSFEIRHFLDAGGTPGCEEVNDQRTTRKYRKRPLISAKGREFKKVQRLVSSAAKIAKI